MSKLPGAFKKGGHFLQRCTSDRLLDCVICFYDIPLADWPILQLPYRPSKQTLGSHGEKQHNMAHNWLGIVVAEMHRFEVGRKWWKVLLPFWRHEHQFSWWIDRYPPHLSPQTAIWTLKPRWDTCVEVIPYFDWFSFFILEYQDRVAAIHSFQNLYHSAAKTFSINSYLLFITFLSVLSSALLVISFDLLYYWCYFPMGSDDVWNMWFWIFFIPTALITCLNWNIILLALKKDWCHGSDCLKIFSYTSYNVACMFTALVGALLLVNLAIVIVYTVVTWVLASYYFKVGINTSGGPAVRKWYHLSLSYIATCSSFPL